jgi:hypothetical protein
MTAGVMLVLGFIITRLAARLQHISTWTMDGSIIADQQLPHFRWRAVNMSGFHVHDPDARGDNVGIGPTSISRYRIFHAG